jgi:hypothetical protein
MIYPYLFYKQEVVTSAADYVVVVPTGLRGAEKVKDVSRSRELIPPLPSMSLGPPFGLLLTSFLSLSALSMLRQSSARQGARFLLKPELRVVTSMFVSIKETKPDRSHEDVALGFQIVARAMNAHSGDLLQLIRHVFCRIVCTPLS